MANPGFPVDPATFHRSLRLRIGGTEQPKLRASLVSLALQNEPPAPPSALIRFAYMPDDDGMPPRDPGHVLAAIAPGATVELECALESGPVILFAGKVVARGIDAQEGAAPQTWIRVEAAPATLRAQPGSPVPLTYGAQLVSFSLGEQDDAMAQDEPGGQRPQRSVRGTLRVLGWLSVAPGEIVEVRRAGALFDGDMRVTGARTELAANTLSTHLSVIRMAGP